MRRYSFVSRTFFTMMLRDRTTFIGSLLIPLALLLVLNSVGSGDATSTTSYAAWLTVGVLVQGLLSGAVEGDIAWLTATRDRGILWRMRAAPLSPVTLLLAYISARLGLALAKAALILAVGVALLGVHLQWSGLLPGIGLVLLGGGVFLILGQAVAAAAPTASAAAVVASVLFYPIIFTSNLFISGLPTWLEQIARWNPAYMLVDLLRPALLGVAANQAPWINLVGLLLYGLAGIMLAARFFQWEPKQ